jgi:hypothetical protein
MKLRILRWLLALACWGFAAREAAYVLKIGGGFAGVVPLLFAFAGLIVGLLLASPEIVVPIANFFADRFTGVIYPGARADRPPLSYLLAHRYREQMRVDEAIVEYQKIIHYYPKERPAYLELLALAQEAGEERIFRKYSRRYARRFHQPAPVPLAVSPSR